MNIGIMLLRWMTGLIFFVAGAGKVMGWFNGFGMKTTLEMFKTGMNISAPLAYLSSYTEFIGGFLLIVGFLTRPAAFALVINMLVAVVLTGTKNFFMGGAAYPCSLGVSCLVILLTGPMAYSIDALLTNKKKIQLANS
jgi:putative oxidoreductase